MSNDMIASEAVAFYEYLMDVARKEGLCPNCFHKQECCDAYDECPQEDHDCVGGKGHGA